MKALLSGVTFEEFMLNIHDTMSDLLDHSISYGFPFAHLLSTTATEIESVATASQRSSFKSYSDKYMQVLKDMAYIRANPEPAGAGDDYVFTYCSPTVNIFALNEEYFFPLFGRTPQETRKKFVEAVNNQDVEAAGKLLDEMFGGTVFANYATLAQVEANYTSSAFDQEVKWSSFLKQLEINPSVLYNPDRLQINEEIYGL